MVYGRTCSDDRYLGNCPMVTPRITMSVRLTPEEMTALQEIADRIGHGATPTGVILQAIRDKIKVGE